MRYSNDSKLLLLSRSVCWRGNQPLSVSFPAFFYCRVYILLLPWSAYLRAGALYACELVVMGAFHCRQYSLPTMIDFFARRRSFLSLCLSLPLIIYLSLSPCRADSMRLYTAALRPAFSVLLNIFTGFSGRVEGTAAVSTVHEAGNYQQPPRGASRRRGLLAPETTKRSAAKGTLYFYIYMSTF